MYPTREEAIALLAEAEPHNPGPWGDHSRTAAHCAEKIAAAVGLDPDKAFVLGLLHDIGRRYGDYPQNKWDMNLALKAHFEQLAGRSIYDVVEKDSYHPST